MADQRMVRLAEMLERVSAKGTKYYSGYLGDAQLLMFDAGERDHPTKAGERIKVWRLLVTEREGRPPKSGDAQ